MVASLLQIAGLVVASVGVTVFFVPAGLVCLGASLFWVGFQLERSK